MIFFFHNSLMKAVNKKESVGTIVVTTLRLWTAHLLQQTIAHAERYIVHP